MSDWVLRELGNDVSMHFSAFHPDYKMNNIPHTHQETLSMAREIAMDAEVRYAYTGNVHHKTGGSTFRHQCGENLISRDWYQLGKLNLSSRGNHIGTCNNCGASCAGFFEATPGNWGAKRKIVVLR
jgi:pyruvate formate lyase activating enzyme